ncbi:MAG: Ig domain-containing protein [Bryobacterales bacterium]|nr:Ig domain-containing protein [Bryobacterales bacterium]MDE0292775.1 Ig domain-containing protein [Bryobacterales bacterium]
MNTTGSRSTRQLHSFITHLGFAIAFAAGAAQGGAESDWTRPFTPDEHTVVLYHFDEGRGNETLDACGDPELTLRAMETALWGSRPGFGATARFDRKDAGIRIGPVNNDKLQLRTCPKEWTIEMWVRYTGPGGKDHWKAFTGREPIEGYTYANLCGTDDEGFSLPHGYRHGWSFSLHTTRWSTPRGKVTLKDGILPGARFLGYHRGRDPRNDAGGFFPWTPYGWIDRERAHIRDTDWHHVVWQFRFRDQTGFLYLDGKMVRKVSLPPPDEPHRLGIINDAPTSGIPFMVGGIPHSADPPTHFSPALGNLEGEIDELRISNVMRYPVADKLAIIHQKLPDAGLKIPYQVQLGTDAPNGNVTWKIVKGDLPEGLSLDEKAGAIHGIPQETVADRKVTLRAGDEAGQTDSHTFTITVERGRLLTESLPPAFESSMYFAPLKTKHMTQPLRWEIASGTLPPGLELEPRTGLLTGAPVKARRSPLSVRVTDANGLSDRAELLLRVLPEKLRAIGADQNTVVLYDWQGPGGRLFEERISRDKALTLTYTNMGGDRRYSWPGRDGRFPQETGHGEHGYANIGKEWGVYPKARDRFEADPRLDLKTCNREWTVEAWVRRGGAYEAFGSDKIKRKFEYGHICGTYDNTKSGVWELYLSSIDSPDGSMAPGVHFQSADYIWKNLDPWKRPEGIVADQPEVGIKDTEWHHVAWQYNYKEDLHQLFVDGKLIWRMRNPDNRKLVNDRKHKSQFSVFTRLGGYSKYGGKFNFLGFGNFFGQIGEIRISNVRRY